MTAQQASNSPGSSNWMTTLGWAAYLGMSWTWCIGMFLPVLLVRDYGIWGFVTFAVPNVVGAAAMGWVMRDKGTVRSILLRHRWAGATFSIVTMVFQVYFAIFIAHAASDFAPLITSPTGQWQTMLLAFAACTLPCLAICAGGDRTDKWCAVVAWCVSAAIGVYLLSSVSPWRLPIASHITEHAPAGLAFLSPVVVFGFALCPYLDLTFLKSAANQDPRGRRASFTFGFGVLFLSMILMTLVYSPLFIRVANGTSSVTDVPPILVLVLLHMTVQLGLTIALHAKEAATAIRPTDSRFRWVIVLGVVLLAGMAWALSTGFQLPNRDMTGGEIVYRLFMSFYGLVFPAYVWLCMIPTRDGHSGIDGPRGRRKLLVLTIAVLLAAPCFWMGFIERQEWWLAPGLFVVLVSRFMASGSPPPPPPAGEGGGGFATPGGGGEM